MSSRLADLLVEFEEDSATDLILSWRNPDETDDDFPGPLAHPDIDADWSPDLSRLGYSRNRFYNVLICRLCERCVVPAEVRAHSWTYHGVRIRDPRLDGFGPPYLH